MVAIPFRTQRVEVTVYSNMIWNLATNLGNSNHLHIEDAWPISAFSGSKHIMTGINHDLLPMGQIFLHYSAVLMSTMTSAIASVMIVYSTVYYQAQIKENIKAPVTGFCEGNSPVTGEFPAQRASKTKKISIWWRNHGNVLAYVVRR